MKVVDDTKIVVGKKLVRIRSHLNLEFFQGFVDLALSFIEKIGDAEIVVGAREAGIKRNRFLKLLCRIREQTRLPISATNDDMELWLVAEEF